MTTCLVTFGSIRKNCMFHDNSKNGVVCICASGTYTLQNHTPSISKIMHPLVNSYSSTTELKKWRIWFRRMQIPIWHVPCWFVYLIETIYMLVRLFLLNWVIFDKLRVLGSQNDDRVFYSRQTHMMLHMPFHSMVWHKRLNKSRDPLQYMWSHWTWICHPHNLSYAEYRMEAFCCRWSNPQALKSS